MWRYYVAILLILSIASGCDDNPRNDVLFVQDGEIFGTVTNVETAEPIEGASVSIIDGKSVLTDEEGKYFLEDIPFSGNLNVIIAATDYEEHKATISLQQELLSFDIRLSPVESLSAQILVVFDGLSRDVASLDPGKISSIQAYYSRDYATADDDTTILGIFMDVIPPDYDGVPGTIANIFERYRRVEFGFTDPDIGFEEFSAVMHSRFTVIVETYPPDPLQWEIVLNCRFDLRLESEDWKITYCQLIPPFIKCVENRL